MFTLSATAELGLKAVLDWIDDLAGYGELRMVTLAPTGDIFYFEPLQIT